MKYTNYFPGESFQQWHYNFFLPRHAWTCFSKISCLRYFAGFFFEICKWVEYWEISWDGNLYLDTDPEIPVASSEVFSKKVTWELSMSKNPLRIAREIFWHVSKPRSSWHIARKWIVWSEKKLRSLLWFAVPFTDCYSLLRPLRVATEFPEA